MKKKVLSVPAALVMLLCVFMANPVTGYCAATDDDIIVFSEDDSSESSGDTKKQDADAADSSEAQESTAAQSQDTDSRETQSQDTQNSDSQSEDSTSSDKTDEGSQNQAQDDGDFTIDGKAYVLSERYTDSEIPKGFERSKLSIHGGTYDELVGNGLTLVYLKPADNIEGSGQFYIYDREKDSVSPFVKLGKKTHYCILLQPDKLINKGLIEEKLERKGVEYTAYRFPEIKNRFYYVYGKDENGDTLWYEYDTEKNRVFLANSELLKAYKSTGKAASKQTDDTTASSDDSTDSS